MKSYYCKVCEKDVDIDDADVYCKDTIGQYGTIVLATVYCQCGCKLADNEIVDNSGNIPPKGYES